MIWTYLCVCLFAVSTSFITGTVEAIIGGQIAGGDQFPYQVSVQAFKQGHLCGGGILDEYHILTAAHCVIKSEGEFYGTPLFIQAGANVLQSTSVRAVNIVVDKILVSMEYNASLANTMGDIAILKLKHCLYLASIHRYLKPLDLPRKKEIFVDKTAKIAGFGWNRISIENRKVNGNNSDKHLRYSDAFVLSNKQCQACYPDIQMLEKHMCARVRQRDKRERHGTCTGDSGGPLVYGETIVGVLSKSPYGCSEKIKPAVYTRISFYLKFISHAIKYKKDKSNKEIRIYHLQNTNPRKG